MTMPAQEAAPPAAERRAARQANQTPFNLVLALIASLGIVAFLVIVVVRPEMEPRTVDYRANAAAAQAQFGGALVVPDLPAEWTANRAEPTSATADGVARYDIGFLTPGGQYIEYTQGFDANPTWLAAQVKGASAGPGITIGGIRWTVYDRRDAPDIGNVAYALVADTDAATLVISGTAVDAEFEELALAIAEQVR